jgi:hypothetical protein
VAEQPGRRQPVAARPTEPGWWLGEDGQWYPPESRPPVSFKPQETGWTQRDDGLWYPPNHAPATVDPMARRERVLARPPEPGWWQASDGWWYPPEARPGAWGSAPAHAYVGTDAFPTSGVASATAQGPAALVAGARWRPVRGLSTALTVLFWIAFGVNILLVIALVNQRVVFEDVVSDTFGTIESTRVEDADSFVAGVTGFDGLLRTAIIVVFIIWFWRAAKNNEALGRQNPRLGPGWAIGGWFIPLANFVFPLLIAQDLWKGSEAATPRGDRGWRQAPVSGLIGWWWAMWIASAVGSAVAAAFSGSTIEDNESDFRTANIWTIAATIATLGAAVLAIYVVRQLSTRQETCLAAQQQAWAASHPAGG